MYLLLSLSILLSSMILWKYLGKQNIVGDSLVRNACPSSCFLLDRHFYTWNGYAAVSREDLHGFFHRIESLHNSVKIVVKHTLDHWMKITGIHLLFTLSSRFCVQTEVDKRSRNTYEFQFLNLHREEEREDFARSRILYFPEEGTLEAQAPYLTRILSLCYLPLCKETGGTKDTACYQIERLSRCSVGMVTRGNETPVNKNNGRGVSKVSRVSLPPFSTLTIMLVN